MATSVIQAGERRVGSDKVRVQGGWVRDSRGQQDLSATSQERAREQGERDASLDKISFGLLAQIKSESAFKKKKKKILILKESR